MPATTDPSATIDPAAELPDFTALEPAGMAERVRATLTEQTAQLERLAVADAPDADWIAAMERVHTNVHRVWGPLAHLNAVASTPAMRDAYNDCLPLITEFHTAFGQNESLYRQFDRLGELTAGADPVLDELIRQNIRDFRLGGVALTGPARDEFRQVMLDLSTAQAAFEHHLMDSTDAFSHLATDSTSLSGLPASVIARARAAAESEGLTGWLLKLDPPTYIAVQTHADDEALRELYYRAWVTRSSDLGPSPETWNNAPLIEQILRLRARSAELLGFANFAELSLATKMAESAGEVIGFLEDLAVRSRRAAIAERGEIERFAGQPLAAWDVAYFSEQLRQARLSISAEALRAYFPLPKVLEGLFGLAGRLFGLTLAEAAIPGLWHETARYFRIDGPDGQPVGGLLVDLYARPNKRGGAWMDGCVDRARLPSIAQLPVAYLVCNFAPPGDGEPSYLTHNDVQTLFHEFGHALHHLLTEIDYPSIAGINGVAWDAVELPSQFLENYAWLPEVLTQISAHRDTGESLPADTIETLRESRSFLGALAMVRQLEFALFDIRIHSEMPAPSAARVQEILNRTRTEVGVFPVPDYNRFQCSFSHIFAGGYAAGYYSYKWAEVLAADAFAAFDQAGPFDSETAARFRRAVLAVGGSQPAMRAFVNFRGREPELEPLLRQTGIA